MTETLTEKEEVVDFNDCPYGPFIQKQIDDIPRLMKQDRELIISKIEDLTRHSDLKDTENERQVSEVVKQMERRTTTVDKQISSLNTDFKEMKKDIQGLTTTMTETSNSLKNVVSVLKWILGVFTAILVAVVGGVLIALF